MAKKREAKIKKKRQRRLNVERRCCCHLDRRRHLGDGDD